MKTTKITWDAYFMSLAFVAAQRSPDPRTKHAAIIVNSDQHVLGMGYNGHPRGGLNDGRYDWNSEDKYDHIIHAELNAILNCIQPPKDARIYITGRPCVHCALAITQSGIKEVIYGPVESRMDTKWDKTLLIFSNHFVNHRKYTQIDKITNTLHNALDNLLEVARSTDRNDTTTSKDTEE